MVEQQDYSLTYVSFEPLREGHDSYTHVIEIVRGLEKAGWNVTLLAPTYKSQRLPGILLRLIALFWLSIRVMLSPKTDAYYARMHFAGCIVPLAAGIHGSPSIVEVNGPFDDLYLAWPAARYFRCIFDGLMLGQMKHAAAIISVTPGLQDYSKALLTPLGISPQYEVISNGANVSCFKPKEQLEHRNITFLDKYKFPYVIFFGSFAPWQGIDILLEAAVSEQWPEDLNLLIAGDGAKRLLVEEEAKKNTHIHYLGSVAYEEMPYLVANALCSFILKENTSIRQETGLYPLKLFETLASGIPAIVTDVPGQADVIRDGDCGVVISSTEPELICEVTRELLDNPRECERLGRNGHHYVKEHFSWEVLAMKTHLLLKDIINQVTV